MINNKLYNKLREWKHQFDFGEACSARGKRYVKNSSKRRTRRLLDKETRKQLLDE